MCNATQKKYMLQFPLDIQDMVLKQGDCPFPSKYDISTDTHSIRDDSFLKKPTGYSL